MTRVGSTIAAYATRDDRPAIPFWPLLFNNVTIRLLGSDDFPNEAKQQAANDLNAVAARLNIPLAEPLPLNQAARAHDQVDTDNRRRVLLKLPTP